MLKYIALVLALAFAAPAAAQEPWQLWPEPDELYFVGPPDELLKIRTALRILLSQESLAHNLSGWLELPQCREAPFTNDPTCYLLNDGPWGIENDVGCMESWYRGPNTIWHSGSAIYLGQSAEVDVDPTSAVQYELVTIPSLEDLVPISAAPPACQQRMVYNYCGPIPSIWSEMMCGWGFLYCCDSAP